MIRREGRVDNHIEPSSVGATTSRRTGEVRGFERQVFVLAVIIVLMLGAIYGVNGLTSLLR
jgi:hypothetical protein